MITKNIDDLTPHPAQALIPDVKGDDRARLKEDLATNGQQDPIHVTDTNVILDGVQRWTLLRENGATTVLAVVVTIPEADQKGYVIARAVNRRHLTGAEKGRLIDSLLGDVIEVRGKQRIGRSATDIGRLVGVSQQTVSRRRDQLLQTSKLPDAPTHAMGDDGKLRPLVSQKAKPKPRATSTGATPPTVAVSVKVAKVQADMDRDRALHILDMLEQLVEFVSGTSPFAAGAAGVSDMDAVLATGLFDAAAIALGEQALVAVKQLTVEAALRLP